MNTIVGSLQGAERRICHKTVAIKFVGRRTWPVHAKRGMLGAIIFIVSNASRGECLAKIVDQFRSLFKTRTLRNQHFFLPFQSLRQRKSQSLDIPKFIRRRRWKNIVVTFSGRQFQFAVTQALHAHFLRNPRAARHISVGQTDFESKP